MVAEPTAEAKGRTTGPRPAILYLLGSIVQGLGLLLIQPFAIRLLSPVEWGVVSTSVVAIQVVVVLISAGLPLAITRLWFDPADGQGRARGMYGFLAVGSAALGAFAAAGQVILAVSSNAIVPWPAVMATMSVGLLGSVLGSQAVLRAQNRPLAFVALSMVSSVAANLAGLCAIWIISPTATAYLMAYASAVGAAAVLAVVLAKPHAPWRVSGVSRESVRIAVPLLPHTGALMLLTQGAVLLLALTSGAAPAGQYGAVLIFALGPLTLLNALNNAWATRLMETPPDNLPPLLRVVSGEALLAGAAIGILGSAAATSGGFILTQDPGQLIPVARTLPLVSIGYALFLVATNVVYIVKRTRAMAYVSPGVLLLTAAVAVPFALRGDLLAVAAIQAGGFVLLGLVYWLVVRKVSLGAWPMHFLFLLLALHLGTVFILGLLPATFLSGVVEVVVAGLLLAAALFYQMKILKSAVQN